MPAVIANARTSMQWSATNPAGRSWAKAFALACVALLLHARSSWQYDINFIGKSFALPGNATYDYVVVGGGTAGNAVATRLAQNGSFSVAVVEAGGFYEIDNSNRSVIPADAVFSAGDTLDGVNPRIDWLIETTPQTELTDNRKFHYPRGKCLGGSSARNYFFYHHGTKGAYAKWADEVDDQSYEYDTFRDYFKRSVHFNQANNALRPANASYTYTGPPLDAGGPVQVSVLNYVESFALYAAKGFESIGVPMTSDFVNGVLHGVAFPFRTEDPKDATRSSSETSYLRLAIEKTGLQIYHYTMAKKILFDGKRASGVLVESSGLTYTLKANKEIIVSGGAFQSPQMLMLSGIGPKDTLSKFGIESIADRPGVGQNLQDHVLAATGFQVDLSTHSGLRNATIAAQAEEEYLTRHTGLLSSVGSSVAGWEKLPYPQRDALSPESRAILATLPADWPELELLMFDDFFGPPPAGNGDYAAFIVALVAPQSRGTVTISSASAADLPVVDPRWLSSPVDRELMVAGLKRIREAFDSPAVQSIVIGDELVPGRNVSTDAEILEYIRSTLGTVYHPSCTCKMGKADDPMAVVDSRARVYGVEGLRVVDASSFPFLTPGHPQATIYALAEKIAEDILLKSSGD